LEDTHAGKSPLAATSKIINPLQAVLDSSGMTTVTGLSAAALLVIGSIKELPQILQAQIGQFLRIPFSGGPQKLDVSRNMLP
jgi:hypothetical protein